MNTTNSDSSWGRKPASWIDANAISYFINLFMTGLLALLSVASIWETDLWFHLKAGEWIVNHHAVPFTDPFSYTAAGKPWMAESWLSQVVFYLVYHWTGIPGLILFKCAVIVTAFLILYKILRCHGTHPLIAWVVVFLAAVLARERFVERPHIFTFLFLAAYLYVLDLKYARLRWWLVPLQILWTNMHGQYLMGILLCCLYGGWDCYARWNSTDAPRRWALVRETAVFLAAIIGAAMINPFGWEALHYALFTIDTPQLTKYIVEFRPTTFAEPFRPFWIYTAGLILLALADKRRKPPELLAASFLLILAVMVNRFRAEFLIVSAPVAASGLLNLVNNLTDHSFNSRWGSRAAQAGMSAAMLVIMTVTAVWVVHHQEGRMRPGLTVNEDALPVRAAEFIARHDLKGHMFNTMGQGGYLLWRLYPRQKVFIDGRTDVYGPHLLEREVKAYQPEVWKGLMDEYHFEVAVLDNMDIVGLYPARNLDEDPGWALVYFDDVNLIYVRRQGPNRALAQERAYHWLKPNSPSLSYLETVADRAGLLSELQRAKREAPTSLTAALMLARVQNLDGHPEEAAASLRDAVHGHPQVAAVHALLAQQLMRVQDTAGARQEFRRALALDGNCVEAMIGLGDLDLAAGNMSSGARWLSRAQALRPGDPMLAMKLQDAAGRLMKSP